MNERRINRWVAVLTVLFVLSGSVVADSLITRDDFICYDTTHPLYYKSLYPSVGIDSAGNLNQINYVFVSPHDFSLNLHQYTRFDRNGVQTQPVLNFLPDTISDSIWETTGWYWMSTAEGGRSVIPYFTLFRDSPPLDRVYALVIDTNGQPMGEPVCLSCEPGYSDILTLSPHAGINNDGVVAIVWEVEREWQSYDSVFVRLYYSDLDSLSPFIEPLTLPQPEIRPGVYGYWIPDEPAIAIAGDGSFVVTWVAADGATMMQQVYYVAYNSDGTPKCDVQLANCLGAFMDTAQCSCFLVNTVDVTMETDGDFYIVWSGNKIAPNDNTRKHVWMRGFNADGMAKYDPIRVNDADSLYLLVMTFPQIACDDSGNVLVNWSDSRLHPDTYWDSLIYDVYAQKVDRNGNLIGPNMRVNDIPGAAGLAGVNADCDMNNSGQVVFIWTYAYTNYRIQAQLMPYDMVGTFVPGDINYDLSGNVADVTTLVNYLFRDAKNTFWPRDLVDFNGDGRKGNVADLTYLVDYLFRSGPVPHTPDPGIRPPP
jgi:hypothetical protein